MKIWIVAASGHCGQCPEHAEQRAEQRDGDDDEEPGQVDRLALDLRGEDVVLDLLVERASTTSMMIAAVSPSSAQSAGTRMEPEIVAPRLPGIVSSSPAITPSAST